MLGRRYWYLLPNKKKEKSNALTLMIMVSLSNYSIYAQYDWKIVLKCQWYKSIISNEWGGRVATASRKVEEVERAARARTDKKEAERWGWYGTLCGQPDSEDEQSFLKK